MVTRRSLVVFLAGVNLLLLTVLLIGSYSVPAAFAQAGGQPGGQVGEFVAVTAKAGGGAFDVLYILDRREQKLYPFYPTDVHGGQYASAAFFRDLAKDFKK